MGGPRRAVLPMLASLSHAPRPCQIFFARRIGGSREKGLGSAFSLPLRGKRMPPESQVRFRNGSQKKSGEIHPQESTGI